jgi:hypothetical protein
MGEFRLIRRARFIGTVLQLSGVVSTLGGTNYLLI